MKAVRCRDGSQLGSPLYSQRTPVVVELGLGNESRCRFHSTLNILEAGFVQSNGQETNDRRDLRPLRLVFARSFH